MLSRASNNSPRGIWSDGDVMYVADASDGRVYSYNMPDAIDARLASLTLSDVDFGEFSGSQTEYEGVASEGATETTVEASAEQRRATVAIEPADTDEIADGHQVLLDAGTEITITVTSADESHRKVYRVRIGDASEEQSTAVCLSGAVTVGFSLVVYAGGSVGDLEACAQSRNVTALYVPHEGDYVPYILGAPEFVNLPFRELFPDGVPALTPLIARSDGPPSEDPGSTGDDGATQPWPDCLRGAIAAGFNLAVYEGGSVEDLDACALGHDVSAEKGAMRMRASRLAALLAFALSVSGAALLAGCNPSEPALVTRTPVAAASPAPGSVPTDDRSGVREVPRRSA